MEPNKLTLTSPQAKRIADAGHVPAKAPGKLKAVIEHRVALYRTMSCHFNHNSTKEQKIVGLQDLKRAVLKVGRSVRDPVILGQISHANYRSKLPKELNWPEQVEKYAAASDGRLNGLLDAIGQLTSLIEYGLRHLKGRPDNNDELLARSAKPALDHFTAMVAIWREQNVGPVQDSESSCSNAAFAEIYRLIEGRAASRQRTRNRLRKWRRSRNSGKSSTY